MRAVLKAPPLLIVRYPLIVTLPFVSEERPYETIEESEETPGLGCLATVERP